MWVNLGHLIRNRVADRRGNTLPVDVSSVTYDLRDLAPGGRSLVANNLGLNTTLGSQALPPPCPECCTYDSIGFNPGLVDVGVDVTYGLTIDGNNECNGDETVLTPDFTSWRSGNSSIASVTYAKVKGVAPGVTTGYANGLIEVPGECACNLAPAEEQAPVNVGPYQVEPISTASQFPASCPKG